VVVLSKFEQRVLERLLSRFYDRRVLAHVQHETRLGHTIRGRSVTLYQTRPGFDEEPAKSQRSPIAQFRFDARTGLWSLYCRDRSRQWRLYDGVAPAKDFETLLDEVDRDPTYIFWG
jgi:nicotinamidase-related amidase